MQDFLQNIKFFLNNTKKLKQEHEFFSEKKVSWQKWKEKVKEIIEFYLSQNIKLTSKYADEHENSIFHKKARENLERFVEEDIEI